ncbi:MAG: WD40/YVTN/BNR-like repeat-containing protein, partial [Terriglobia bacterium]
KSTDGGASWNYWGAGLYPGLNALVIDPVNPSVLYGGVGVSSEGGVLKSTDGGATWKNSALWDAAVTILALDRHNPNILYAGTERLFTTPGGFHGLYKSSDGGASWSSINEGLTTLVKSGAFITALLLAPNSSNILYAGASGDGVYKSLDGGSNWFKFNDGLTNPDVRAMAVSQGAVYAATSGGVFKIVDETPR